MSLTAQAIKKGKSWFVKIGKETTGAFPSVAEAEKWIKKTYGAAYKALTSSARNPRRSAQASLSAKHGLEISLKRVPINRQGYEKDGTYWGVGQPLWHYTLYREGDSGDTEGHFRADDRAHALEKIKAKHKSFFSGASMGADTARMLGVKNPRPRRRKNVAVGQTIGTGKARVFHPFRSSPDYDPSQLHDAEGKRARSAKKRKASKKKTVRAASKRTIFKLKPAKKAKKRKKNPKSAESTWQIIDMTNNNKLGTVKAATKELATKRAKRLHGRFAVVSSTPIKANPKKRGTLSKAAFLKRMAAGRKKAKSSKVAYASGKSKRPFIMENPRRQKNLRTIGY